MLYPLSNNKEIPAIFSNLLTSVEASTSPDDILSITSLRVKIASFSLINFSDLEYKISLSTALISILEISLKTVFKALRKILSVAKSFNSSEDGNFECSFQNF